MRDLILTYLALHILVFIKQQICCFTSQSQQKLINTNLSSNKTNTLIFVLSFYVQDVIKITEAATLLYIVF